METKKKSKSELLDEFFELEQQHRIESGKALLSEKNIRDQKLRLKDKWCVNEVKWAISEVKERIEHVRKENATRDFYETEKGKAWKNDCENQLKQITKDTDALKDDVSQQATLYVEKWLGDGFAAKFTDLTLVINSENESRYHSITLHFREYPCTEINPEKIYIRYLVHERIFVEKDERDIKYINALSKIFTDKEKYHNLLNFIIEKVSKLDELRNDYNLCYNKLVNPLKFMDDSN